MANMLGKFHIKCLHCCQRVPRTKKKLLRIQKLLRKGYKETIALNIWDALRETIQDSTGLITMVGVLGAYFLK